MRTGIKKGDVYKDLSEEQKAEVDERRLGEVLAYLVENHPEVGLIRRVIAIIKRVLVNMGISPDIFKAADFRALADIAVRVKSIEAKDSLIIWPGMAYPSRDGNTTKNNSLAEKNSLDQGRDFSSRSGDSLRDPDEATEAGENGNRFQSTTKVQPGRISSPGRPDRRTDLSEDIKDLIAKFSVSSPFQKVTAKMLLGYNFKNWFGRSIMRDQQTGKPFILYNGSIPHFSDSSPF